MADIELMIKIDDKVYEHIKSIPLHTMLEEAVIEGTPLPKGHGRLIDADKLLTEINTYCDCKEGACLIKDAPTIIDRSR